MPEPRTLRNPEPSLDPREGTITSAQLSLLHRAPRTGALSAEFGCSRHEAVQAVAHDAFGVDSLKQLSKAQASELLVALGVKPLQRRPQRPRRPSSTAATRMREPWHLDHIQRLAYGDLGWAEEDLTAWLQKHFEVRDVEQLTTAKQCGKAIKMLRDRLDACQPMWAAARGTKGRRDVGTKV